jgi:hypothetical protein
MIYMFEILYFKIVYSLFLCKHYIILDSDEHHDSLDNHGNCAFSGYWGMDIDLHHSGYCLPII